jgi:DNA-binding NtrC family response regulator
LSLPAQVKLLRVLESGEVRRVGGFDVEFPNVRIVAATNRDLHQLVREGTFREDLLFRLQVLSVRLPPLRERMSDVKPLVLQICRTLDGNCIVQPGAMGKILGHDWPGNVRELRNVLSRAFVLSGGTIQSEHIEIFGTEINPLFPFEDEQSDYLEKIFHRCGGNRSKMARELGIPRTTLLYKLKKAGLIE